MIGKNIALNLLGMLTPVLLAIGCIPPLIKALGVGPFGVLTLVWVVLGYFSLFDIGIGRALTRLVSERVATSLTHALSVVVRTATGASLVLGCLGGALLIAGRHWIVQALVRDNPAIWPDVERAIVMVGLAVPFVTATAALRGTLEAVDRFDLVNYIRLAMGVFSYAGPLLVVQVTTQLSTVVAFLLLGRVAFFFLHLHFVRRAFPRLPGEAFVDFNDIRPLFALGGWMTVSNIVSSLLTYLDRIVVAAVVGATFLAYYTTPYEAVTRLTVVPDAIMGVLFPALVAALAVDRQRAVALFGSTFRMLLAALVPVVLVLAVFAGDLLRLWVGEEFARQGTVVFQLLAAGVLLNSLARLPFTVVHSAGRPDLTAKAHLLELLPFLAVLWLLTTQFGIVGSALAWLLRVLVDFLVLEWFRRRLLVAPIGLGGLRMVSLGAMLLASIALVVWQPSTALRVAGCAVGVGWLWATVLTRADWWVMRSVLSARAVKSEGRPS